MSPLGISPVRSLWKEMVLTTNPRDMF